MPATTGDALRDAAAAIAAISTPETQDNIRAYVRLALFERNGKPPQGARRKFTLTALGEHLGLSVSSMSHRMDGDNRFTAVDVAGIAEYLEVPTSDILAGPPR